MTAFIAGVVAGFALCLLMLHHFLNSRGLRVSTAEYVRHLEEQVVMAAPIERHLELAARVLELSSESIPPEAMSFPIFDPDKRRPS